MRFTCATCGTEHDLKDISFGADAPLQWKLLSNEERSRSSLWGEHKICRSPLFLLAVLLGVLTLLGCSKKPDADELVIFELKKAGSDLSKPHKIDFYLYLPTQSAAEQAVVHVRDRGFEAVVRPAAKGTNWLCLAKKALVPNLSDIKRIGRDFDQFCAAAGGDYDGWEAEVTK